MNRAEGRLVLPLPGDGLVAHEAGLSLVCAVPGASTAHLVDGLLDALAEVAAADGDGERAGRLLVRRAARILAAERGSRPLACAVAGPAGHGAVAVLASGAATARVVPVRDAEIRIGGDPGASADRIVGGPVAELELMLPGAGPADPRLRLGSGVVRGGGLREVTVREPEATPRAEPRAEPRKEPRAEPHAKPRTGPRAEPLRTRIDLVRPEPLPAPSPPAPSPAAPSPTAVDGPGAEEGTESPDEPVSLIRQRPKRRASGPRVLGVNCKNHHFNDPRAAYCAVCGISMLQMTLAPFHGPRPPLGVLLFDDGHTIPLDDDQLIGREPARAQEVTGGRARPVRLTDRDGSISRRHVLVALQEWRVKVVDLGSVNGTALKKPGEQEFQRLPPESAVVLPPGSTVRVGRSRTFRFESNRE
ncbi:FHA domain-containing protein [Spirillospora sp. NBC_01491]|uniref:FHA domain-containing protein n=1 Tax=Spirillospora sp. NBC_01491 TaxID=2976007 RepID=UPI002E319A59|nr:FHA domain-containing protein [Spirillospora sp. NBC_01491]